VEPLVTASPVVSPGGVAPVSEGTGRREVREVRVLPESVVMSVGEARDMLATVRFSDGSFDGNVVWSTTDSRLLEVNPTTGRLSAQAEGVATLISTAITDPSKRALVTVTVRKGAVQEAIARIEPAVLRLTVGSVRQLSASVQMSDGSVSPNVRWETSHQGIALISPKGLVTAVGKGQATITVFASGDSTRRAVCEVTVE
jgi:uncharacterized protein YjdB